MSGTKNFYFHLNGAVNLICFDEIADDLKPHLSWFHLKTQKKRQQNKNCQLKQQLFEIVSLFETK